MKSSDSDILFNQLVVAALTVLIVVILLFAAVVMRQIWLQQRIAELSSDVQVTLEVLEETTDDVQRELAEILTTPGAPQDAETLEEVTAALADVEDQIDALEDDLSDVEAVWNNGSVSVEEESDASAVQDQADEVFTIFAVLVGVAALVIALLLGLMLRVQQRTSPSESRRPHEPNNRRRQVNNP